MGKWKSKHSHKRAQWINGADATRQADLKGLTHLAASEPDDDLRAIVIAKLAEAGCDVAFAKADDSYAIRKIYYTHYPQDRSDDVSTEMLYSETDEDAKIEAFERLANPNRGFLVNVIVRQISPGIAKMAYQMLRERDDAFFLSIATNERHSGGKREAAIGMLRDFDSLEQFDTAGQHARIINAIRDRKTWWHETMVLNSAFWDHGVRWESLQYVKDNEVLRKAAVDKQHPYDFREAAVKRIRSKETLEQILSDGRTSELHDAVRERKASL